MKIYNYLLTAVLAIAMFAACTPAGEETAEKVTLVPSSETIEGDGVDVVTFTVLSGETDVTAEAKVFKASDNTELVNKSFSTDIPGEYEFYATYGVIASDNVKVTALEGATISTDKAIIVANGEDQAVLTVTQEGQDVTAESTFYLLQEDGESVQLESNVFTTTEAGQHQIYAKKGTASSAPVAILATAYDNEPSNFNFRERAMLLQFTAQGCGYCPLMKKGLMILHEQGWDDGISVACHIGFMQDSMYPTFWNALWTNYGAGATGIPAMSFNLDTETGTGAYANATATATNLKQITSDVINKYPVTAGISATFLPEGDSQMKVTATFKASEAGDYKVAAWLLEDHIDGVQSDYNNVLTTEQKRDHCDVLRAVSNQDDFTGDVLNIGAGESVEKSWTFNVSSLKEGVIENARVVVFITKKEANGLYIVNNIINCNMNDSVGFEYVE